MNRLLFVLLLAASSTVARIDGAMAAVPGLAGCHQVGQYAVTLDANGAVVSLVVGTCGGASASVLLIKTGSKMLIKTGSVILIQ